jgi:oligopeptide transport system substrate-binding protein
VRITKTRARMVAPLLALALGAAACGGDDGDTGASGNTENGGGESGGTFSTYIAEPENPLVPGNTSETEGGQVVDALFTGLVTYNTETTELEFNGVAESIESDDNTTWTVTLKDDWTFHDGTPVTSDSFIDAWNYTALSTNAQGNSYFFGNVEGYDDLQAEEEVQEPSSTELSGLKKVSDTEFTVTLKEPFAQYPLTVGYTAFYPLPEAFFDDPDAFGKQPIGNGPFKADGPFQPGQGITLSRYEDYAGDELAKADSVEIRVYTDANTAYTDVQAGNLDIMDQIPPDAIATAPDEFGDRYIERPSSSFQYMGFPTYDPRFDDKRVRQAFSMAVDRQGITEAIFNGTRQPAYSAISPVVDGARDDACEYCQYDPERAKALLAETDFDTSQPVELWFNAGAGHDEWVQAVGNNLRENLGIEYVLRGDLQFAEYLPKADEKGFTGPFRLGWAMDYPSPQNYLEPLYSTGALPPNGSNTAFYSNPEFDDLIAKGNRAESNEEAIEFYQQAEDVLLEDMPIMPIMFGLVQGVHSDKVSNVTIDAFTRVRLEDVTVNQ